MRSKFAPKFSLITSSKSWRNKIIFSKRKSFFSIGGKLFSLEKVFHPLLCQIMKNWKTIVWKNHFSSYQTLPKWFNWKNTNSIQIACMCTWYISKLLVSATMLTIVNTIMKYLFLSQGKILFLFLRIRIPRFCHFQLIKFDSS